MKSEKIEITSYVIDFMTNKILWSTKMKFANQAHLDSCLAEFANFKERKLKHDNIIKVGHRDIHGNQSQLNLLHFYTAYSDNNRTYHNYYVSLENHKKYLEQVDKFKSEALYEAELANFLD